MDYAQLVAEKDRLEQELILINPSPANIARLDAVKDKIYDVEQECLRSYGCTAGPVFAETSL